MDAIGKHGPISLNALCGLLPDISRAGIWRATAALRDYGWVRTRLADSAFELTSKLDFGLANAHFAHMATERAVEEIQKGLSQGETHVTVGMFVFPGQFEVIETTQQDVSIGRPLSLVFDECAQDAQCQMDSILLLKHLAAYLNRSDVSEEEADLIRTGQHINNLRTLREMEAATGQWVRAQDAEVFLRNGSWDVRVLQCSEAGV